MFKRMFVNDNNDDQNSTNKHAENYEQKTNPNN